MQSLTGQVVLVTGAARGIGRAIAAEALDQGAAVALLDIDGVGAETAAAEMDTDRTCAVAADVSDAESVAEACRVVRERLGGVTVLVNNAGRNSYGDATTMSTQEWDEVFAVDLKGAWLTARAVLGPMIEARRGSIVNIASLHARLTIDGMFPYAAAKSGLVGLTRSLALDVARHGIRVNAVSPGYVDTALGEEYFAQHADPDALTKALAPQPFGRFGTPREVAAVVCFLASDGASYVTGADWSVDGGLGARFA